MHTLSIDQWTTGAGTLLLLVGIWRLGLVKEFVLFLTILLAGVLVGQITVYFLPLVGR